ncbi:hypothetical protein M422DRAFT_37685 [Sphaerobolus stellatus SS14]|uniref:CENP-V/GFA domain-containing protein n=1 Tax=Sphaerobolus stellatus (strain SS14) TaxID=990650 RepID=A0A0C9UQB7_SPHS4|nr:hypothetical protein M422DRAFT_37685 [Sphaerobolus stellatus SS14]
MSQITGNCLCGKITYNVDIPLEAATPAICQVLKGDTRVFVGDTDAGPKTRRTFCPNCGSQVCNHPDSDPKVAFIKAGTMDNELQKLVKPIFEVFVDKRLPFINDRYGAQFAGMPPSQS